MSSEDIVQGQVGDCWFLASCAAVSRSPKFMKKVRVLHNANEIVIKSLCAILISNFSFLGKKLL